MCVPYIKWIYLQNIILAFRAIAIVLTTQKQKSMFDIIVIHIGDCQRAIRKYIYYFSSYRHTCEFVHNGGPNARIRLLI